MSEKTIRLKGSKELDPAIHLEVKHTHSLGLFEYMLFIVIATAYSCAPTMDTIAEGLLR